MTLSENLTDAVIDTIAPPEEGLDGRQILIDAGFNAETINNLGEDLITRFEASYNIYSRGVEGNLALLDAITQQRGEGIEQGILDASEATTEEVTTAIEGFIEQHPHSIGATIEEQTAAFRERSEAELTTQIEEQINQRPIIGWIANIFNITASDIATYGVDRVSGNGRGFLVGIVFAFLGLRGSTLFQNHLNSISQFTPNLSGIPSTDDPVTPREEEPVTIPEAVERNRSEVQAVISGGYVIMSYMSGVHRVENSDSLAVYEQLGTLSYSEIQERFRQLEFEDGNLVTGEITRVFGIQTTPENEGSFFDTIQGVVGPYNTSFFNSMFVPQSNIGSIIFEDGDTGTYSHAALEIFSNEELDRIQGSEYQDLKIDEISRLTVLYCKGFYSRNIGHLQAAIGNVSQSVRDFIFGEEVQQTIDALLVNTEENGLYPESVGLVFANILSGRTYINSNTHGLTTGREGFEDLSTEDIEKVDAIVQFRNQITDIIPREFALGIPGFSQRFANQLNYGKVISLYIMMGGRDLTERTQMDDIVIYTWIYNLFEGSDQGLYESAILEAVGEESNDVTEDQRNLLTIVLFRLVESNRNTFVGEVERIATLGHELVKDQILGDLPVSERIKDYLAYALEAGGAYALWRILSLFPTTRAVLFITGGVTIGAVLILSREAVYQQLSSEMQAQFDAFLETTLNGEGEQSGEEIRRNIESGDIGTMELMSRFNENIEGALSS